MFLLGTILNANAQVPSYLPKDSLKGWWPFNGNANDESGNGNNGTVSGAAISLDRFGISNSAYLFNGTNNYIGLPLSAGKIANSKQFTISYWINPKSINGIKTVFSHWIVGSSAQNTPAGFYTNITDTNIFSNYIVGYGVGSFKKININNWYNVVIIYDGTQLVKTDRQKLYIDGVLQNLDFQCSFCSSNIPPTIGTIASSTSIGARLINSSWTEFFDGSIDDIAIWNRALTQNEITKLYIGCNKTITQEPVNQGMFTGNATFTCATNDTLVNYQWQSDLGMGWNNLSNAGQYSGTTSNSLQVSNVTSNNNNQKFRCITKGNCLTDTTNEVTLRVWGLGVQSEQIKAFKVYPNPTKGQVTIENGDIAKMIGYTVSIYNSIGQQLFQSNITQQQSLLDISQLGGNGLYFMEVTDNNGNILDVKKIVLQ